MSVPADARTTAEGAVDAAVWGAAAIAGMLSCLLLSAGGYLVLTVLACVPIVVPIWAMIAEASTTTIDQEGRSR